MYFTLMLRKAYAVFLLSYHLKSISQDSKKENSVFSPMTHFAVLVEKSLILMALGNH